MGAEAPIVIVPYDPRWPDEIREIAGHLRETLRDVAVRIDHVGSTAVPGLDAKPVIDIQVSVAELTSEERVRAPLEGIGYRFHAHNPDRSKRFFLGPEKARPVHLHVRELGSFDEQLNLLFRDYLRSHRDTATEYARVKWELATTFRNDREGYVRAKEPTVWSILRMAHDWSQETGWRPGPSDR